MTVLFSVNSDADGKLTKPLIKASGLTPPVLMGSKRSHFSKFLSMDISVATVPFLAFTVKSLEQFPYTVSYGGRRSDRCIRRGKASFGTLGGAWEQSPGEKAGAAGMEGHFRYPGQRAGTAGAGPAAGGLRTSVKGGSGSEAHERASQDPADADVELRAVRACPDPPGVMSLGSPSAV